MAQPDLRQLQASLATVGNELAKIPNLPIFAMQDQILGFLGGIQRSIDRLDARMDRMEESLGRVEERINGFDARMDSIDARMDRIDASINRLDLNTFTRLQNSKVLHPYGRLYPMCGTNGQPTENFPQSPRAITELSEGEVDRLLRSAELPLDGTIEQKRDRFRFYIGLSVVA